MFLVVCTAFSQKESVENTLMKSKHLLKSAVDQADGLFYRQAQQMLEPLTADSRHAALVHYYIGYIQYQMGVVVERLDKDRAVAYLDSAVEQLQIAIDLKKDFADAYALLSSCYGLKIGFSPMKAIILGPKSGSAMKKALELEPGNPRVVLLDAVSKYNTPALFGGSKDKALQGFKQAAELFNKWTESDSLRPSWGREETYAWMGIAYMEREENMLAKKAFEKAMEINPNYGWVKYVLMPKLQNKLRNSQ